MIKKLTTDQAGNIIDYMTARELWYRFKGENDILAEDFDAWSFGDDPDKLAKLVLEGKKTATSSVYELYEYDNETPPKVGEYSVILDSASRAVCIVQNVDVKVVPFSEVDSEHAMCEGEGDGSIQYWRSVHEKCFGQWLEEAGKTFSQDTLVVLERFKLVYKI